MSASLVAQLLRARRSQATAAPPADPPHRPLPSDIFQRILELLPPNDLALAGRFACKETARMFREKRHCTVYLSLPLNDNAAAAFPIDWAEKELRNMPFSRKLLLLSTAAASGCVANLETAWRLLTPSIFVEALPKRYGRPSVYDKQYISGADPGTAAAQAGHAHVLPWLVSRRVPLDLRRTLLGVARQCGLAALKDTWQLLSREDPYLLLDAPVAWASATSATPDAYDKLQWVLQEGGGSLTAEVAAAAASGPAAERLLPLLQALRASGCSVDSHGVLAAALRNPAAGQEVLDWLVDVVGCPLPATLEARHVAWAAAAGAGEVWKLRWLEGRGVALAGQPLLAAAAGGHLHAVQVLHEEYGSSQQLTEEVLAAAVAAGSVPTATWLRQAGCPMGPSCWEAAVRRGDLAMVRWLADAKCPWDEYTAENLFKFWPNDSAHKAQGCLEAARVLAVVAGCPMGGERHWLSCEVLRRGDLPLVTWLHDEARCHVWPMADLDASVSGGCEAVIEWVVRDAGRDVRKAGWLYGFAARNCDRSTLEVLFRLGAELEGATVQTLFNQMVEGAVVVWLMARAGAELSREMVKSAREVTAARRSRGAGGGGGEGRSGEEAARSAFGGEDLAEVVLRAEEEERRRRRRRSGLGRRLLGTLLCGAGH